MTPFSYRLAGLWHRLPFVGDRVVEADQLQNLAVFLGDQRLNGLPQLYKPDVIPQRFEYRIIEEHWPPESALNGRFQRRKCAFRITLERGDHGFRARQHRVDLTIRVTRFIIPPG
jgi:hypothetical protein